MPDGLIHCPKTSGLTLIFSKNYRRGRLGCAGSDRVFHRAIRGKIAVQGVDGGVQNKVTVGTSFEMTFDFGLYRLREPTL
jgi:hypothetical protein